MQSWKIDFFRSGIIKITSNQPFENVFLTITPLGPRKGIQIRGTQIALLMVLY